LEKFTTKQSIKLGGFMEIFELLLALITVAGLFIWNRTESRTDTRHMEGLIKSNRDLIDTIHKEWIEEHRKFNERWMEESKSFHARLCDIEARKGK